MMRIRRRGFSLQKIRKAIDELRDKTGERHFAQREVFVLGRSLFGKRARGEYVDLLRSGQLGLPPVVEQLGKEVEYSAEAQFAERWLPTEGRRLIVVDPRIAFGAPNVSGIPTWVLRGRYNAGESLIDIKDDFGIPDKLVIDGLTFEGITLAV